MSRWNAELQAPAPAPAPVAPAPSPAPSEGAGDVPAHPVVSGWLTRSSSPELEQGVQPEWAKEAHKDMICEHCGLQGHVKRHCPKRYTLTKEQQERKDAVDDYKAGGQKAKEELDKIQPEGWGELGSDPLASSSSPTSGCTPRNAHSRAERCGFADTVLFAQGRQSRHRRTLRRRGLWPQHRSRAGRRPSPRPPPLRSAAGAGRSAPARSRSARTSSGLASADSATAADSRTTSAVWTRTLLPPMPRSPVPHSKTVLSAGSPTDPTDPWRSTNTASGRLLLGRRIRLTVGASCRPLCLRISRGSHRQRPQQAPRLCSKAGAAPQEEWTTARAGNRAVRRRCIAAAIPERRV